VPSNCPYPEHLLIMYVKFVSYGLDGPGFESREGQEISSYPKQHRAALESTQLPSYSMITGVPSQR
jgi:hypothetical protein